MARIKHTKNELKAQRDALARYQRYLPTLQLKKQQLQLEVRNVESRLEQHRAETAELRRQLESWVRLLAEPVDLDSYLRWTQVRVGTSNIAGVTIPVLESVEFERELPDLFHTPAWVDDALNVLEELMRRRVQELVLEQQLSALRAELRTTSQRVNLFEKVKIPETRENIRVIRIFLGDQMTAEIARAKIAKGKSAERVTSAG
jgi:V/A-type H+-transporting ATPase subunit D